MSGRFSAGLCKESLALGPVGPGLGRRSRDPDVTLCDRRRRRFGPRLHYKSRKLGVLSEWSFYRQARLPVRSNGGLFRLIRVVATTLETGHETAVKV